MIVLRIIVAIFSISILVTAAKGSGEKVEKWRSLFDLMYSKSPVKDYEPSRVQMSLDKAKKNMQQLFDMLPYADGIPSEEREEIAFWSTATRFTPEDCTITKEFSLLKHYARFLSNEAEHPHLKVYLNFVKEQLLNYCISNQSKIVAEPLSSALSMDDTRLIRSFDTKENPVKVDYVKVAKHIAPLYVIPKIPKLKRHELMLVETKRQYDLRILNVCRRIKKLPESTSDAIKYFDYNKALSRVDPKADEWLRMVWICDTIGHNLARLSQEVSEVKRAQLARVSAQVKPNMKPPQKPAECNKRPQVPKPSESKNPDRQKRSRFSSCFPIG